MRQIFFISAGIEPSSSHVTAQRRARICNGRFTEGQIQRALREVSAAKIVRRDRALAPSSLVAAALAPPTFVAVDLRVAVCLFCGDDFLPDLILRPFLKCAADSEAYKKYFSYSNYLFSLKIVI